MPRIRTIKPDFWTDEKIVTLSPLARLLFIGTWNFADDEGRMEFSQLRLKLQILPLESTDLSEELGELRREKLISIYSIGGNKYLQVVNFAEHQKVDKRTPSKFPECPPPPAELPRVSPPEEYKEEDKEEEAKKEDIPLKPPFEANRIQLDLPDDWRAECVKDKAWPADVVDAVWTNFRSHYGRAIGRNALRTGEEWRAQWKTWYLKENIKPEKNSGGPGRRLSVVETL